MSIGTSSDTHWSAINGPPQLLWQGCQPEHLINGLCMQEQHSDPLLQQGLVHELQQLLCRLFPYTHTLLIEALSYGFSSARVVKVQPFYQQGGGARHVLVKFGEKQTIKQEYENYQKYVQHFIGDGRSTTVLSYQQATHLEAISYAFLGVGMHQMQEFGAFYQRADAAQVKRVLDTLFRQTCGMWYANHNALQPVNLTEDYQRQFGYTLQQLQERATDFTSVSWSHTLTFKSLRGAGRYRFSHLFETLKKAQPIIRTTYVGIMHGDLNQRNILIDQAGLAWLIDFQKTGPSHILRDLAMLDTVIRLQLLHGEQATLAERLALEEALGTIKHFKHLESLPASYVTGNPALAKTWETIIHVRKLARWAIEKNPFSEMSEYALALLYTTMNTLSFTSLEIVQREHALLSASLLVDQLVEGKCIHS